MMVEELLAEVMSTPSTSEESDDDALAVALDDPGSTLFDLAYPFGVFYPYPRDVVVDKNLKIRAIRNSFNSSEIQALVEALLEE